MNKKELKKFLEIHKDFLDGEAFIIELDKPFRTPNAAKKFAVYVMNDKGNIVLVRFGDQNMKIRRQNKKRRKNFRARHKCDAKPPKKWEARYWSCKFWSKKRVRDLV